MSTKNMTTSQYLQKSVADRMLGIYSAYGIRPTKVTVKAKQASAQSALTTKAKAGKHSQPGLATARKAAAV